MQNSDESDFCEDLCIKVSIKLKPRLKLIGKLFVISFIINEAERCNGQSVEFLTAHYVNSQNFCVVTRRLFSALHSTHVTETQFFLFFFSAACNITELFSIQQESSGIDGWSVIRLMAGCMVTAPIIDSFPPTKTNPHSLIKNSWTFNLYLAFQFDSSV